MEKKDLELDDIAGLVAPAATMIAAMMTAANLGARITGWGFVVFTIGSVAWSVVGLSTGQANLVATNAFLTIVNLVGVWRWLGRQRAYEDGAKSAVSSSRHGSSPVLFSAAGVAGMKVTDSRGEDIGKAVEAMIECGSGCIAYMVCASGGVGGVDEELRAVPRDRLDIGSDGIRLRLSRGEYERLAPLAPGDWPGKAEDPV